MEPRMDEEELLEPILLSGESGSRAKKSTSRFRGGLLMLLLGVWTLGVYGFFTRGGGDVAEERSPAVREEVEEEIDFVREEVLPAEETPTPAPEMKVPERVRVISDPSEATILLDGVFVGMTPLEMDRPGVGQRLAFRKSGYEPMQVAEDVWRGESELKVMLKPITGQLRISVSPPHARLWLNGTELVLPEDGVLELPLRSHRIKAVAPGYEDLEIEVLPAFAYERRVMFELEERSE